LIGDRLIGHSVGRRARNDEWDAGRAIAAHRKGIADPNRSGKLDGQMRRQMHLRSVREEEAVKFAARRQSKAPRGAAGLWLKVMRKSAQRGGGGAAPWLRGGTGGAGCAEERSATRKQDNTIPPFKIRRGDSFMAVAPMTVAKPKRMVSASATGARSKQSRFIGLPS
jgi:hypothetical protein